MRISRVISLFGVGAGLLTAPVGGNAWADGLWNSAYIGINAGYGQAPYNDQLRDISNGAPNLFSGLSPKGTLVGGQFGINQQFGKFVAGIEVDLQGGRISDTQTWGTFPGISSSRIDNLSTYRLRGGYAFDKALLYVTGGFATARVHNREFFVNSGTTYDANARQMGVAYGGGLEYKFNPQWSLKTELLHVSLGKTDPLLAGTGGVYFSTFTGTTVRYDEFNVARIGLNYSFSFDRPAVAPMK